MVLIVNAGLLHVYNLLQMPLAQIKNGFYKLFFLFHILPDLCEFTPPNGDKKLQRQALFWGRGTKKV